jgi:hypothetical protein
MENNRNNYIKADDDKIINENHIRWIKKINSCMEICTKSDGCDVGKYTHKVCKSKTPDSYKKLNSLFD